MSEVKQMSLGGQIDYSDVIMGIDLGTTNSAVAVYNSGNVPTLCSMGSYGKYTLQSCVRWDGDDKFTVGEEAYKERYKSNVMYSVKRIMGSSEKITLARVNEFGEIERRTFTPVEISGEILKELKAKAQDSFPGIHRCIITVPAYFNQRQIEDTLSAAEYAELDCVQILKEPTSASYIYSLLGYARDGSILVYDLGGGTFDITHMTFLRKASIPKTLLTSLKRQYNIDGFTGSGVSDESLYYCRVLGTYGDTHLGGDDIDTEMAKIVVKESKVKLEHDEFEQLILECEQFKKNDFFGLDIEIGGKSLKLTKEHLEKAIKIIFDKTMRLVEQIPPEQLATVGTIVLVGGSTKSNYLVSLLKETFPHMEISRALDPDATVAQGAGAVAKDLQQGKAIAYQDVLPLPIGVLLDESRIEICIPRNTAMPYSVSRVYQTLHDNQRAVSVDIYQGLSSSPEECTFLGKLRVPNLQPKPAGEIKVKLSFVLSAQGRLKTVAAVDGVEVPCELIIDSIFDVAKDENVTQTDAYEYNGSMFPYDEFESGILDLLKGNDVACDLCLKRRKALVDAPDKVSDLEAKILDSI